MVGFVPIQGQARLFESVPSIPADSACFTHANFLSGEYGASHFVHACGVPARSVRVRAEQARTFLADCWLIAAHRTSTKLYQVLSITAEGCGDMDPFERPYCPPPRPPPNSSDIPAQDSNQGLQKGQLEQEL